MYNDNKIYIAKFIRDDDERLTMDGVNIFLDNDNTLLKRPDPDTTEVNFTEANGGRMVAQRNPIFSQSINGLLIPKTDTYRNLYQKLATFWKINHTYKIIYCTSDGTFFAVDGAWISAGLQIPPRPHEDFASWSITLNIGRDQWREYAEDSSGKEIYTQSITLPIVTSGNGGEIWDTVGTEWDTVGEEWHNGRGGVQDVLFNSTDKVYPVWVVTGPCDKPMLQNNTTNTFAKYNSNVAAGQTLTVNFETGMAMLDTAVVSRYVEGIVTCNPGINSMGFNTDGGAQDECTVKWDNCVS